MIIYYQLKKIENFKKNQNKQITNNLRRDTYKNYKIKQNDYQLE